VDVINDILQQREQENPELSQVLDKYEFNVCCRTELMTFITADQLQDYQQTLLRHFKGISKKK
jgi:hypothetical protein